MPIHANGTNSLFFSFLVLRDTIPDLSNVQGIHQIVIRREERLLRRRLTDRAHRLMVELAIRTMTRLPRFLHSHPAF